MAVVGGNRVEVHDQGLAVGSGSAVTGREPGAVAGGGPGGLQCAGRPSAKQFDIQLVQFSSRARISAWATMDEWWLAVKVPPDPVQGAS